MFLLNIISAVQTHGWQRVREQAHSLLPYHGSFELDRVSPLKCTIKRNQEGDEIMGVSVLAKNIKSRLICFLERKQQFIDFPRKNIRAWIGEHGNIVFRPILKEKPYRLSLEKGYRKLVELHISSYKEVLSRMLGI